MRIGRIAAGLAAFAGLALPAAAQRATAHAAPQPAPQPADLQAAFMKAVREMIQRTEDVGPRFAEEARRIHYGEAPERGIRGKASPEEREALRDEGIETFALPVPPGLEGPLQ